MTTTKNINNLADLQAAIRITKQRIKEGEADIQERWQRLPQETVKATVGAVVPFMFNKHLASGTWNVLKGIINIFLGKKEEQDGKETIVGAAKQLGISTIMKLFFGFFKK